MSNAKHKATHRECNLRYQVFDQRLPWYRGGDTIVFHHGLGACADLWLGWLPALSERYRIVTFDMRGHGESVCAPRHKWDIECMLGDLNAVLEATTDGSVHLVGESIGGTVALAYAMTWPERIKTLTISNGAHIGASIGALQDWRDIIERDGMGGWSRMMMERRFYPGAISRAAREWFETQQSQSDPSAILGALEVLVGADLRPDLALAHMPVQILHPDDSPFIAVSVAADLCERLPNARLQVFSNTRHGLPFSHASQCAAALSTFLGSL
jgi:pimeloyl-ACP methyl ester carboxylesterase